MSGLQRPFRSSVWRVNKRRVQIPGHQSADLVGAVVVRHRHACWAQWVIRLWPRARSESTVEMRFVVLFCSGQVEVSTCFIYRKELVMDCTVSRGLRSCDAICEGLLRRRLVFDRITLTLWPISFICSRSCQMVSVRDFRMTVLVSGYLGLTPWPPDFRQGTCVPFAVYRIFGQMGLSLAMTICKGLLQINISLAGF